MKEPLLLIGGGGHCVSCIDVIETVREWEILGIIDSKEKVGELLLGYKYIGCDDDLIGLVKKSSFALITVGQIESATLRIKLYLKAKEAGYSFPVIIASTAWKSKHTSIGAGTIVMHKAFINSCAQIGENCIINTAALIEHNAIIGDHVHISTAAVVNGGCTIGTNCFIGSNSVLKNGISVVSGTVIGAGTVVSKDIIKPGVYAGNPARIIR